MMKVCSGDARDVFIGRSNLLLYYILFPLDGHQVRPVRSVAESHPPQWEDIGDLL